MSGLELVAAGAVLYLLIGLIVWAFIFLHGGFLMPDGKTPAPFWSCMFMTTLMWPAALKAMEIL